MQCIDLDSLHRHAAASTLSLTRHAPFTYCTGIAVCTYCTGIVRTVLELLLVRTVLALLLVRTVLALYVLYWNCCLYVLYWHCCLYVLYWHCSLYVLYWHCTYCTGIAASLTDLGAAFCVSTPPDSPACSPGDVLAQSKQAIASGHSRRGIWSSSCNGWTCLSEWDNMRNTHTHI